MNSDEPDKQLYMEFDDIHPIPNPKTLKFENIWSSMTFIQFEFSS